MLSQTKFAIYKAEVKQHMLPLLVGPTLLARGSPVRNCSTK